MLDCKANFPNQYGNILVCRMCKNENTIEDEDHILKCKTLNTEEYAVNFKFVYGTSKQQYELTKIFKKVMRKRTLLLSILDGPVC